MKYKNITYLFILIALASASLFFVGCEAVDNPTGDDPRDPLVGEWMFLESFKSTESQSYLVTISKDPNNSSQVIIGNLGNPGSQDITVKGLVTSGQVVVSQQNMGSGWTIQGSGSFSNVAKTSMAWSYSITAGGSKDDYTATATLQ